MAAAVALPFEGLPTVWVVLFTFAFGVICAMLAWTTLLFVRGQRARKRPPSAPEDATASFAWVVLVPALNEEVCTGIRAWVAGLPRWRVLGVVPSPLLGPAGNREFLIGARRQP